MPQVNTDIVLNVSTTTARMVKAHMKGHAAFHLACCDLHPTPQDFCDFLVVAGRVAGSTDEVIFANAIGAVVPENQKWGYA